MGHGRCILFAVVIDVGLKGVKTHCGVSETHIKVLIFVREVVHYFFNCLLSPRFTVQVAVYHHH